MRLTCITHKGPSEQPVEETTITKVDTKKGEPKAVNIPKAKAKAANPQKPPTSIALANKTKALYINTMGMFHSLMGKLDTDNNFQWANNPTILLPINTLKKELDTCAQSHPYMQDYLNQYFNDVKATYSEAELEVNCSTLSKELDPILKNWIKDMGRIQRMHASRMKS